MRKAIPGLEDVLMPLPEGAPFILGLMPRPDLSFLAPVIAQARPVTIEFEAKRNPLWLYGISLYNAGYYWEAHEAWELVWQKAAPNSRERALLQGLIHLTNAALKTLIKKPNASARLLTLASQVFDDLFPQREGELMGLQAASLFEACCASDQRRHELVIV